MSGVVKISARISDQQAQALDSMAAEAGITRSTAVRRLIEGAVGDGGLPSAGRRLTTDEQLDLLHERARSGSIQALRMIRDIEQHEAALAEVDRMNAEFFAYERGDVDDDELTTGTRDNSGTGDVD